MIRISVILPVYNVAPYLEQCLDSIITQDFDDFEVICVYDKSSDNSLEILNKYSEKYSCVKVVEREQKNGLSAARNTGMKYAQGKYIWFIDSDDYIVPGAFKKMYEYAETNQSEVVICNFSYCNDDILPEINEIDFIEIDGTKNGLEMMKLQTDNNLVFVAVWRNFIRHDFYLEKKLNFYEGILAEDWLFYYYLYTSAQKMINLNEKLYVYRRRASSLVHSLQSEHAASLFVILANITSHWMTNDFSNEDNITISRLLERLTKDYNNYNHYRSEGSIAGGFKEKFLYKLLNMEQEINYCFDEKSLRAFKKAKRIILYGAGRIATQIITVLEQQNLKCGAIVVTSKAGNAEVMHNIHIQCISDISPENGDVVVIGAIQSSHDEMIKNAKACGFKNIVVPQNIQFLGGKNHD